MQTVRDQFLKHVFNRHHAANIYRLHQVSTAAKAKRLSAALPLISMSKYASGRRMDIGSQAGV